MKVENARVAVVNFELIRGRSMVPQTFRATDSDTGAPLDITGFALLMDIVDCNGNVVAAYSVGDGFAIPEGTDGIFVMTKDAGEKNVPAGMYGHELKVTAPNGFVGSWWRGSYQSIEAITE